MLRDRLAQVLPHWNAGMPGFGYILGMYAFGLEENADYANAEATARRSLELVPDNAAAIHVLAHVMEMQGRAREGVALLERCKPVWAANAGFAVHIAWHLALFELDLDASERALAIYDTALAPSERGSTNALVDASALLWRLTLRGVEVGARWRTLAKHWKRIDLEGQRAFTLAHAATAFAAAGRMQQARRLEIFLRSNPARRAMNAPEDLELSIAFIAGLQAFVRGDYRTAVERLDAVRAIANRCGGSVAQCDCIHLTLTEAALRAHRAHLARALTAERTARKPFSALNRWLFARAAAFAAAA
jgi:tetratricopeptide (TPR) repeat protein